jgi:hypothetical protein
MLRMGGYRLPAFCSNCGAVFPSVIAIGGGSGVFRGNAQRCRFCGGMAQIADATFQTTAGEVLAAIQAPGVTRAMLVRFSAAVKRAYVERTPPELLAEEVARINPIFAELIRRYGTTGLYLAVLLAIVLTVFGQCSTNVNLYANVSLDANRLVDQLMNTSPDALIATPEPPTEEPPARATDETPSPDEPGSPKAP